MKTYSDYFEEIQSFPESTFINQKFDKARNISYSRKYTKRDVVFWELMDNTSFQTTLFLCI